MEELRCCAKHSEFMKGSFWIKWYLEIKWKLVKELHTFNKGRATKDLVRFQVLITVSMKFRVFWDVLPCSQVDADQHFSGEYCLLVNYKLQWYPEFPASTNSREILPDLSAFTPSGAAMDRVVIGVICVCFGPMGSPTVWFDGLYFRPFLRRIISTFNFSGNFVFHFIFLPHTDILRCHRHICLLFILQFCPVKEISSV
jgi:hypothetical protein